MNLNRRSLLKFAAAGASVAASRGLNAAPADFPMDDLLAHARMRGVIGGERTYWYYKGTVFGNAWGKATQPMLGVEGVSYCRITAQPDGSYRYDLNEAGYYQDPHSGEINDSVLNPFTGERYQPKHYLSPQSTIFAPDLSVTPASDRLPPNLEYKGRISPVRTFMDSVWSSEDLFVRIPIPSAADDPDRLDFMVQTSLATFSADRRHVLDLDLDFVPCQLSYQTLATFREWMNMGRSPGMMSWRMSGTKCRYDDLPAPIVARIRADHADFF